MKIENELLYYNESLRAIRANVYQDFLNECDLDKHHSQSLKYERKFSEAQINYFGFKSSPSHKRMIQICNTLSKKHTIQKLLTVPGFHLKDEKLEFVTAPGLLVPQRAFDGKIWSLQRRNDKNEPRYVFVSSKFYDQSIVVQPLPHWSLGSFNKSKKRVWITEGGIKGDRLSAHADEAVLAIPGISYWRSIEEELDRFKPDEVILALDDDAKDKVSVAKSVTFLLNMCINKGMNVTFARWRNGKGVDDAINANEEIFFLNKDEAKKYLDQIAIKLQLPAIKWGDLEDIFSSPNSFSTFTVLPKIQLETRVLPLASIPAPLREFCGDHSERMQVPVEFLAGPLVVFLSALIGRKIRVRPFKNDNWVVVPNLWGGIVAPPGSLKTPSLNVVKSPFSKLEKIFEDDFLEKKKEAQSHITALNIRKKAVEEKLAKGYRKKEGLSPLLAEQYRNEILNIDEEILEITPKARRLIIGDTTTEKLQMILEENDNGILISRDELMGFFRDLEKAGRESARAFFLEAWSGDQRARIDRVSRETSSHVACVSIFGTIQPDVLDSYLLETFSRGAGHDGLIQRFQILFFPDINSEWYLVDRLPDTIAIERYEKLVSRIANYKAKGEFDEVRFSEEAQKIFNSFLEEIERRLRSDEIESSAFQAHLAKYRSLLPSLCLIFHLVDEFDLSEELEKFEIQKGTIEIALIWIRCLESHAEKIYFKQIHELNFRAELLSQKILSGSIQSGSTVRNIIRNQWSKLTDYQEVRDALRVLENCGWILFEPTKDPKGGRSKNVIKINPQVFENFLE